MSDPRSLIHPNLHHWLDELYPFLPPPPHPLWKRLAAEVSDGYDPGIASPRNGELQRLKIRHVVEGVTTTDESLVELRRAVVSSVKRLLAAGHGESDIELDGLLSLYRQLRDFESDLITEQTLDTFESALQSEAAYAIGEPLATFQKRPLREQSRIQAHCVANGVGTLIKHLPPSLILHVLESYPELPRGNSFWAIVREVVAPYWDAGTEPKTAFDLRLRFYGFAAPEQSIIDAIDAILAPRTAAEVVLTDEPHRLLQLRDEILSGERETQLQRLRALAASRRATTTPEQRE